MGKIKITLFAFLIVFLFVPAAEAITVTAAPNPVTVGQTVTVTISANFPLGNICGIQVNFGDSPGFVNVGNCNITCTLTTTHTYTTPGHYTITARSAPACGPASAPDPATTAIDVSCIPLTMTSPPTLPQGRVGQPYSFNIQTSGGQPLITYSLLAGTLPPGLTVNSSGRIAGTPTTPGNYSFTIRAIDSCPVGVQRVDRLFSLNVGSLSLTVSTVPFSFSIPRGITSTKSISYNFRSSPPVNSTLQSTGGQFMGAGQVLGQINNPLTVPIRNGTGRVSEIITIVPGIIKRAERLHITNIRYVRTFSNSLMSVTAQVNITITSEAAGEFNITRIELYFENNRGEITVKRNHPSLKAYAKIRFTGSGLLSGYWQVDGRILSYIYKQLVYGRSIIFETPQIPPLPTFDPGTHILKFVIIQPQQDIPVPSAIYFVVAQEYNKKVQHISLLSPKNDAHITYTPFSFQWETSAKPAVFLIQFFATEQEEKPIFSAYANEATYKLTAFVLKKIFASGESYWWRVEGLDEKENITSQSERWEFKFIEPAGYLPGQIIVAVKKGEEPEKIAWKLREQYHLTVLENFDLASLKWRVFVLHTEENVVGLIARLSKEEWVRLAQPNYILHTMSEPLTTSQSISGSLRLPRIHEFFQGKEVLIAVIDTGIDIKHRDLQGSIVSWQNYVKNDSYKPEIHGTGVAGVIAARINNVGIEGIAPKARILALRACKQVSTESPEGECYTVCLAKAISNALRKKAKIINISAGSKTPDPLLSRLIAAGAEQGTIFVAPVGNDPRQKTLNFPACHPDVMAVGGVDSENQCYPNAEITANAFILAPAVNILTTVPGNKYNFLSGTSFSAAIVTGLLAVAHERDRNLGKNDIPPFKGNMCKWEERLLRVSLCGK